ncbi:ester cyclase [Nocardia sp. BSTN01]|uniref:ester cyclase n=1 Tax=Nocardia sp. BSTN01 TaxID=2783665 RepID=UPI00188F774F|nr:ester cyclase [Nocardia sp. BSTN01]MBF5002397.1 ester cyclase [Nocardia sp. BSTN01]
MSEQVSRLAHEFVRLLNEHDAEGISQLLSEDYIDHNPMVGDGRVANAEFWRGFFLAFPDVRATAEEVIATEDRLVGRFSYTATHDGPFVGIPATGKPVTFHTIDIWHVRDGLLTEHWDEINLLEVLQQIGVVPTHEEVVPQ